MHGEHVGQQATIGFSFANEWHREGLNFLKQSQNTTEQNQYNPGMLSKLTQIDENTMPRTITFTFQVRH